MTDTTKPLAYRAGCMDGSVIRWWSRHRTIAAARRAARRHASQDPPCTGVCGSWSGFVRYPDGREEELHPDGCIYMLL